MSIGQNIKKYRKEKGYTQRELADLIGVSVQAISKWETDTGAPDISQVVPLASALDISTDALFDYEHHTIPKDFEELRKDYHRQEVFRDQRDSAKNYKMLNAYFSAHPQNSEAASLCLKCLVDMIVAGKTQDRGKSELIAECEKYANCIFKYETDIDTVFMNHFVLARGYAALGENEKAKEMLGKIPVTFGDRLYWEAEIAQANKEYDDAMLKCRSSFALKARYISRCIRMAGEIHQARDSENGLAQRIEYEEYMLRLLNAFLSGGDYLPCRQIFQKYVLLCGMVKKHTKLNRFDLALEKAEMLFAGRVEFLNFLDNQEGKYSLLFENNDSVEYQMHTKYQLDCYVKDTVEFLKKRPEYENDTRIKELFKKYDLE
ncbi:MAG: helix-turn-helix transcriptional regulator [Clostridia bacterium]|nr:helix-turn-helix transcriptional regulator [Clostridia bacterium]